MESEKVKEIKKALKCIVNANAPKTEINYYGNLHLDILTLINELESEIEETKFVLRCANIALQLKDETLKVFVDKYRR